MLNREFLDIIHENFEVHATTGGLVGIDDQKMVVLPGLSL